MLTSSTSRQQVSPAAGVCLSAGATLLIAMVTLATLRTDGVMCEQQQPQQGTQNQLEQAQSTENRLESRQQKAGDDLTATIDYLNRMDKLLQMSRPRFGRSEYKQPRPLAARHLALETYGRDASDLDDGVAGVDDSSLDFNGDQWRPLNQWRLSDLDRAASIVTPQRRPQQQQYLGRYRSANLGGDNWNRQQQQQQARSQLQQQQFDDAIEQALAMF